MRVHVFGSGACIVFIACHAIVNVQAAPFLNLDFESAWIDSPTFWELPASEALPFWTTNHYRDGYVFYDAGSLGSTVISIHDGKSVFGFGLRVTPLQGDYSVCLQGGRGPDDEEPAPAFIAQTGDVPGSARSMFFSSDVSVPPDGLVASLNGVLIPMSLYSVGPAVNNWGSVRTYVGDISAFAGQNNVTLRFESIPDPQDNGSFATLDAIRFSSIIVPEPSTAALLTLAAIACGGFFAFRSLRRRARTA